MQHYEAKTLDWSRKTTK